MKLSESQIRKVEAQSGATVISHDHPSLAELESEFGEHTFFIDDDGLHMWGRPTGSESESGVLMGCRLAIWSDDKKTALVPHEPMPTQIIREEN